MTNKELHRLRRHELMELLLREVQEISQVKEELAASEVQKQEAFQTIERLKAKLDGKDLQIERLAARLDEKDEQIVHLKKRLDAKDLKIATLKEER